MTASGIVRPAFRPHDPAPTSTLPHLENLMTTPQGLFTIAAEFATASGNAERYAALTQSATGAQRDVYDADAAKWNEVSQQRAERLRAALRRALDTTPAVPDSETPVSIPSRGVVEIRGIWNGVRCNVRIRYTPAQALAAGAALIACAAITETHPGGEPHLLAFPACPSSDAAPSETTPAEATATDGSGQA